VATLPVVVSHKLLIKEILDTYSAIIEISKEASAKYVQRRVDGITMGLKILLEFLCLH